jgi:hypothetical protein
MLADIEKRYVARGYTLPPNLTWPIVHIHREAMGLEPWMVPIEVAPDICTWGYRRCIRGRRHRPEHGSGRPFGAVLRGGVAFPLVPFPHTTSPARGSPGWTVRETVAPDAR